ncbi:hypothetical protein LJC38_02095 [Parabacteroides sp. OttesenSCG-928-K15]|nr:hypothetical protein [Parabacteroides sp. OttesenSCG-928-K15]
MEKRSLKSPGRMIRMYLPEIILACVCLFGMVESVLSIIQYGIFGGNYIVFIVATIYLLCLIGQLRWKSDTLSWLMAAPVVLGAFVMILAVFSEYAEMIPGDPKATQLLVVGLSLFGGIGLSALFMPWKYITGSLARA